MRSAQNRQVAAGHIGQPPTGSGQPFELTVTANGPRRFQLGAKLRF